MLFCTLPQLGSVDEAWLKKKEKLNIVLGIE